MQVVFLRLLLAAGVLLLICRCAGCGCRMRWWRCCSARPSHLAQSPTWRHIGNSAGLRTPICLHIGVLNIRGSRRIVLSVPTGPVYPRGAYMMMATPSTQVAAPR